MFVLLVKVQGDIWLYSHSVSEEHLLHFLAFEIAFYEICARLDVGDYRGLQHFMFQFEIKLFEIDVQIIKNLVL